MACEQNTAKVFLNRSDTAGSYDACTSEAEGSKLSGGMFKNGANSAKQSTCSSLKSLVDAVHTAWDEEWWRKVYGDALQRKLAACAAEGVWTRPCGSSIPIATDDNRAPPLRFDAPFSQCITKILQARASDNSLIVDATACSVLVGDNAKLMECLVNKIRGNPTQQVATWMLYCDNLPAKY